MEQQLILVDEHDNEIGTMDKYSVHKQGLLHLAFSVFIFNSKGELLLQRRAADKYHSAGLWSNTCCSHPEQGESTEQAVKRRLKEEMGMDTPCGFRFTFLYHIELENGFSEHELDHVYFGISDTEPLHDPFEVMDWRYISIPELQKEIQEQPENFTYWLRTCLPQILEHL